MTEEYLDVLDEQGNKTGKTKLRTLVHRDGDWHRAVNIFIISPRQEILLQRRSLTKDSYPGKLDISCGGHLSAGDDVQTAAVRELAEELGLKLLQMSLFILLLSAAQPVRRPILSIIVLMKCLFFIVMRRFQIFVFSPKRFPRRFGFRSRNLSPWLKQIIQT